MVRSDTVDQCVWTTRILAYVAADGAGALTAGVWHIIEPLRAKCDTQVKIDQPWLNNSTEVVIIHLKNTVHATEDNKDAAIHRNSPTTKTSSSSTRDNGDIIAGSDLDDSCYLLSGCWQYYYIRPATINGSIIF